MVLPFFYTDHYDGTQTTITLDEDTSRHVVQVLRMKTGDKLNLTDGKGNLFTCEIAGENKKHCTVQVLSTGNPYPAAGKVSVAISLLKSSSRFEWFLEKATEIGVREIIPLICERTEKEKFRHDRMKAICISAMLQSQQVWLPVLHEPVSFMDALRQFSAEKKFIAHCAHNEKFQLAKQLIYPISSCLILIGPEGDFTAVEIQQAGQHHFIPVSLGETRLRTETAGMVAAALLVNSLL